MNCKSEHTCRRDETYSCLTCKRSENGKLDNYLPRIYNCGTLRNDCIHRDAPVICNGCKFNSAEGIEFYTMEGSFSTKEMVTIPVKKLKELLGAVKTLDRIANMFE